MYKYLFAFTLAFFAFLQADPWDKLETWPCTYLESKFVEKIDKTKVHTIVELGGYNGLDAILLHLHYQCPVYTFECDPLRLEEIAQRLKPYPDVTLIPMGGWSLTGILPFYIAGHSGASSFFPFNLETMRKWNKKSVEELTDPKIGPCRTKTTMIKTTRLDEWMESEGIEKIDLICMDVQGAALEVLRGLGERLRDVKYVISEVDYKEIYRGETLFPKIHSFMKTHGFKCYFQRETQSDYFNDVLFINQTLSD